jgi:hypothetical protein
MRNKVDWMFLLFFIFLAFVFIVWLYFKMRGHYNSVWRGIASVSLKRLENEVWDLKPESTSILGLFSCRGAEQQAAFEQQQALSAVK